MYVVPSQTCTHAIQGTRRALRGYIRAVEGPDMPCKVTDMLRMVQPYHTRLQTCCARVQTCLARLQTCCARVRLYHMQGYRRAAQGSGCTICKGPAVPCEGTDAWYTVLHAILDAQCELPDVVIDGQSY